MSVRIFSAGRPWWSDHVAVSVISWIVSCKWNSSGSRHTTRRRSLYPPLVAAHGRRAAVREQVNVHVLSRNVKDIVVCSLQDALALLAGRDLERLDDLDAIGSASGKRYVIVTLQG